MITDTFNKKTIREKLYILRCKSASDNNKIELLNNLGKRKTIANKVSKTNDQLILYSLFPPRRLWCSVGKEKRKTNNSMDRNIKALRNTVIKADELTMPPDWLVRLNAFCNEIQQCLTSPGYKFSKPKTFPKIKEINGDTTICRPISTFSLKDKIILSLLNNKLTQLFDSQFYEHSYAFRAKRNNTIVSHQTAVKKLIDFRKENEGPLWVAECDMKKFYDTVNHKIVKKEFLKMLILSRKKSNNLTKKEANLLACLFLSYLRCYNFYNHVYKLNKKPSFFIKNRITGGKFEWEETELLEKYVISKSKLRKGGIGVPQGGALSGLIANLVLNYVDKIVTQYVSENFLYIRFCDDMIMVGKKKTVIADAFQKYQKALINTKLLIHQPIDTNKLECKKDFWKCKSKKEYMWWDKSENKAQEWITFVGYDVNWKGECRVRKKSIQKEKRKQYEKAKEITNLLKNKKPAREKDFLLSALRKRLIGMSVSRVEIWNYKTQKNEMCWMSGFSELSDNFWIRKQMKELDRNRNKVMSRFKKKLATYNYAGAKRIENNRKKDMDISFHYGAPFSYYGQNLIYSK